ncbi:MAG: hypothetical protein QOE86_2316 [Solirubrobacteraceae bacterium]|nr:hypothetical protein [Solirubrobacteraceae bacterium]
MNGVRALEEQLGAPPPPGLLQTLDDERLAKLAAAIHTTRQAQSAALAEAGAAGLRFVPVLLRGPMKKIVGMR